MPILERRRSPISTRDAFASALDLAARRDPLHSLLVPLLVRGPWILALVLLAPVEPEAVPARSLALASLAAIGDYIASLVVGAMLRLRARSVFNQPADARPAPVHECYTRGTRRIPWLFVTEVVRNFVLAIAASVILVPPALAVLSPERAVAELVRNPLALALVFLLALPSLFVLYRLGVATEAVVLDERDLAGAFQRSFRMMRGRMEHWAALILASGLVVLAPLFVLAALSLPFPALADTSGRALFALVLVPIWSVVQYTWTNFYLRLVELDARPEETTSASRVDLGAGGVGEADPEEALSGRSG